MPNSFFVFLLFDSYDVLAVDVATFYYTQEFFSNYLVYLETWLTILVPSASFHYNRKAKKRKNIF